MRLGYVYEFNFVFKQQQFGEAVLRETRLSLADRGRNTRTVLKFYYTRRDGRPIH